jgi:hypothetical protein
VRLPFTGCLNPFLNLRRWFAKSPVGQFLVLDAGDFQVNVDAVQQRAGDALLIAGDGRWRTGALLDGIAGEAAWTPLRCLFAG